MRLAMPCLLACLAKAPAATGTEHEAFADTGLVWLRPASEPGAPVPCARMPVLDLPQAWCAGDAAAIAAAREEVAAPLLGHGRAIYMPGRTPSEAAAWQDRAALLCALLAAFAEEPGPSACLAAPGRHRRDTAAARRDRWHAVALDAPPPRSP